MSKYALTPLAKADVDAILSFIDADNIEAGDRVERAIFAACEFLAKAPMRAHARRDLTKLNVRFWTLPRYSNYTIVCVPGTRPLRIVAVLHGKRNVRKILRTRL